MEFRIREREGDGAAEWIAEWPFPARAHFIASNAYDTLRRELHRYVRGEVAGRSFLIAGHRGAGKTSLVRQAVDDLNRSIIDDAVKAGRTPTTTTTDRVLNLQRPLLVKLHGPSLLGPANKTKEKKDGGEEEVEKEKDDNKEKVKDGNVDEGKDSPEKVEAPLAADVTEPGQASNDQAVFALEQITIGLYRALASEFGRSFANHAREEIRLAGMERTRATAAYLELAGQFTLDLDNAPRPATLRAYYDQLGRVESGVLWPYEIGASLLRAGLNDQGIREMVALATAAQAFEVCSGQITDKQTEKDTRSRDRSVETKVEAGKDVVNKIVGLGAGLLVGIGTLETLGKIGGAAAGLAAGLLSTLTLTWTSKRSAKNERTLDYTFIRDRTKQTLERDLPLVIQRVRDAGLAPVFVLDELDKLANPQKSIAELIHSLKHLTTDYGCFCFLTDRDYYDYVMGKVTKEAYPVEHTFFSHRMFILHQPKQLLRFLTDITKPDAGSAVLAAPPVPAGPITSIEDVTAQSSFGLLVLHRSKMNVVAILRQIADQCDADGRLRASTGKLRSDRGYLLAASIQLLIGLILRRSAIRDRVERESRFMQRAIDALYMLSREWESEKPKVRIDRPAIVKCLLERSSQAGATDPTVDPQDAAAALRNVPTNRRRGNPAAKEPKGGPTNENEAEQALFRTGMTPRDLNLVDEAVGLLGKLLSDQSELVAFLEAELTAEEAYLRVIFRPENLIRCIDLPRREYEFLFDVDGQDLATRAELERAATEPAPAAGVPTSVAQQVATVLAFLAAFESALSQVGIGIADLVKLQVLPPTIDPKELNGARARLSDAQKQGKQYDALSKDLPLVSSVVDFIRQNSRALAVLFHLALYIVRDAPSPNRPTLAVAIGAVGRHVELSRMFPLNPATSGLLKALGAISDLPFQLADVTAAPDGDATSVQAWRDAIASVNAGRVRLVLPSAESAWPWWLDRVRSYFTSSVDSGITPARYVDMVCAAAGAPPGRYFRGDLRQMNIAEWSELCLSAFPGERRSTIPAWAFVAGLRALGFGSSLLSDAVMQAEGRDATPQSWFSDLADSAPKNPPPGFVLVMREDGTSIAATTDYRPERIGERPGVPVLALPENQLELYDEAFAWLEARGVITRVVYEIEEDELPK